MVANLNFANVTKEQIYQAVWEEDFLLSDNNIMAFIRKLRKKVEPQADLPGYIITIWGIGYKFNENNIKKKALILLMRVFFF